MSKNNNTLNIKHLNMIENLLPKQVGRVVGMEEFLISQLQAFEGGEKVLPIDCDRLAWEMKDLVCASVSLCDFLNDPKYCSKSINASRYQFLNNLFGIQQQAEELEKLSSKFRSICLNSSKERRNLHQSICTGLQDTLEILQEFKAHATPITNHYKSANQILQN